MRRYLWAFVACLGCCVFAIGGFAVGAYMQFLQTVTATQAIFAQDIAIAQFLTRDEGSQLLEWMRADARLQYGFLTEFERARTAPLPVRLTTVAQMTWNLRWMTRDALRSSDRLQAMMRECECGLSPPGTQNRVDTSTDSASHKSQSQR
jgi:hypothetical protein